MKPFLLLGLLCALAIAAPQDDYEYTDEETSYPEPPKPDYPAPPYEPPTTKYLPPPPYPEYPEESEYPEDYPKHPPAYPEPTTVYVPPPEYPEEESEYPEDYPKHPPAYPEPTTVYVPPPEYPEEESEYPEEYPKNPPPHPEPATKHHTLLPYPVETTKYNPPTHKPVYPAKDAGKTYPTPKSYETPPTYKHLPTTYPAVTKAKFSWTAWSQWADCSVTCDTGIKKRTRNCLPGASNGVEVPKPGRYARDVYGAEARAGGHSDYVYEDNFESSYRGDAFISDDGGSETEGGLYPSETYAPLSECEGDSVQIEQCSNKACPINGGWSKWGVWSLCSASCGDGGLQTRVRDCNKPVPANGGKLCQGVYEQSTLCSNPRPCPIDGNWNSWTEWCRCSVSCGFGGVQTRGRNCSDPANAFGGRPCYGAALEKRGCCEGPCPVNGKWSRWSEWSAPAKTCGSEGLVTRTRRCDNPAPSDGGEPCEGKDTQSKPSVLPPCPIDGCWGAWGDWSKSSASCGEDGFQTRSRACDSPAPQYDGKNCIGDSLEVQIVKSKPCPVDGGWSKWFEWSKCSASCGFGGSQVRRRKCDYPTPAYDGRPCEGTAGNKRSCFISFCPVDGNWGPWSVWSYGDATCGYGGTKSRTRECDSPAPHYGGRPCDGDALEHAEVELPACPVNGGWTAWSEWSKPAETCGDNGGVSTRSRECSNPKPAFGGVNCKGNSFESRIDQLPQCPICGGWSNWKEWSECSVTCGLNGVMSRARVCDNPAPANDGDACEGEPSQTKDCSAVPCPICGGWSGWTEWSSCSASCGQGGLVIRKRFCDSPAPEHGGATCEGESSESRSCAGSPCAINGAWSRWGGWSRPSVSCGEGLYPSRSRACNNPPPAHGGNYCKGPAISYKNVTIKPCPVNGGWSVWSEWSAPSASCGDATSSRSRSCSNPAPAYSGKPCSGPPTDTRSASVPPCPVNGAWGEWSDYSACSVTCGSGGVRHRKRACNYPAPAYEGLYCPGKSSEVQACTAPACPVDGNWGKWSSWSEPSASCGPDAQVTRTRNCDSPAPSNGGKECEGDSSALKNVLLPICPINGAWTEWTEWSTCSVKCGDGGVAKRSRCCANPEPQYNGKNCDGEKSDSKTCSGPPCGIDGGWTEWSAWSKCSVTCGEGGIVSRTRTCTQPSPNYGGRNCQGPSTEYAPGLAPPCAVDGGWGQWERWSACSVTCGTGGTISRSRMCDAPSPSNGGKDCLGKKSETADCSALPCPIDGGWSDWSEWSKPTVLYGETYVQRVRYCDRPEPQFGGKPCVGDSVETKRIQLPPPPVNGGWSSWSEWGKPSASCGPAIVTRSRKCNNPVPANQGRNCKGEYSEIKAVKLKPCPVDGNWGLWCEWSKCSVTCGAGGTATRTRLCNEPKPVHGGADCRGENSQSKSCYVKPCPVNGGWTSWGQWSTCSATCAEGTSTRTRTCQNPVTAYGGRPCEGEETEAKSCNLRPCDIDGNWNNWSDWSTCSVTCGDYGITTRNRKCDNPAPQFYGKNCVGPFTEAKNCSASPCAVDGGWGVWSAWSSCSKSCGYGGSTTRSRSCSDPTASYGGKECMGPASEVKYCFETNCNNWSPWTEWSTCTAICGIKPFHQRNRQCLLQNNIVYGKNIIEYCEGEPVEFKYCDKPRHIFEPAKYYELNVPGCGVIHGGCVNSWFVVFNRESPDFNMNKNWIEYKAGFGKAPKDFYVGHEYLHCITKAGNYYGAMEAVTKSGRKVDMVSPKLVVGSEGRNYPLYLNSNSSGQQDGLPFSTYDRDNDQSFYSNCAKIYHGGWWYSSCYDNINLFGDYKRYFEIKEYDPDKYLVKGRILIQRNPTADDVKIQPYHPPKYPNKPYEPPYKPDKKPHLYKQKPPTQAPYVPPTPVYEEEYED